MIRRAGRRLTRLPAPVSREVQTLFSCCARMGHVETNVVKRVPRIRLGETVRPPFTPDEVRALLERQDLAGGYRCRNYALIRLLLDTGVRTPECIAIRLEVD